MGGYLRAASVPQGLGKCKLVIVPHAGYRYSGSTAAFSYNALCDTRVDVRHVVILGPSHRQCMRDTIVASPFSDVDTPLGTLNVEPIRGIPLASEAVDQKEHSIEMQFPFLAYAFPRARVSPIFVGQCNDKVYTEHAKILASELRRESTVCVVSSDFCHWGGSYSYHPDLLGRYTGDTMSDRIQAMDREAIDAIFANDLVRLRKHLELTGNTVCGAGPLMLCIKVIEELEARGQWHLLHYAQSNQLSAYDPKQSSVSYVAAAYYV